MKTYDAVSAAHALVGGLGLPEPGGRAAEARMAARDALAKAYAEGQASTKGLVEAVQVAAPAIRHVLRCYAHGALPVEMDVMFLKHVLDALATQVEGKPPTSSSQHVTQPHAEKILAFAQEHFTLAFRYMIEHGTWLHSFVVARSGGEELAMLLVHRPRKEIDQLYDALLASVEMTAVLERVQAILRAHGAKDVELNATFEQIGMPLAEAVRHIEAELKTNQGQTVKLSFGDKTPATVGDLVVAIIGPHTWEPR